MDWRFSVFLLTLIALLAAFSVAPWDAALCSSDYVAGVLRDHTKDGALNCFDFWFNRYQTFIGVLAAILAALATWIINRRQISIAERAVEITHKQIVIGNINRIETRMEILIKAKRSVIEVSSQFPDGIDYNLGFHLMNSLTASIIEEKNQKQQKFEILTRYFVDLDNKFDVVEAQIRSMRTIFENHLVPRRISEMAKFYQMSVRTSFILAYETHKSCKKYSGMYPNDKSLAKEAQEYLRRVERESLLPQGHFHLQDMLDEEVGRLRTMRDEAQAVADGLA